MRPGQLRTTTTIDQLSLGGDEEEAEEETEEEAEEKDVDSRDVVPQTITEDVVTQSPREAPSPESVETVTQSTTVLDFGSENQTNGTPTCTGPEKKSHLNLHRSLIWKTPIKIPSLLPQSRRRHHRLVSQVLTSRTLTKILRKPYRHSRKS